MAANIPVQAEERYAVTLEEFEDSRPVFAPFHPGEHLKEIIEELGISQYRLAKTMKVPPIRIHDIIHERRAITPDTALRLGKALGQTPEFWLNLQRSHDLDVARAKVDLSDIPCITPPPPDWLLHATPTPWPK